MRVPSWWLCSTADAAWGAFRNTPLEIVRESVHLWVCLFYPRSFVVIFPPFSFPCEDGGAHCFLLQRSGWHKHHFFGNRPGYINSGAQPKGVTVMYFTAVLGVSPGAAAHKAKHATASEVSAKKSNTLHWLTWDALIIPSPATSTKNGAVSPLSAHKGHLKSFHPRSRWV